jgi:hexokinase
MKSLKTGFLDSLRQEFTITATQIKRFIKDFHSQMDKGLAGDKSSLEMLPAFVDSPSGKEKGKFIALDLGGSNFRLLQLELKGSGRIEKLAERKFVLKEQYIKGKGKDLFDFIAGCIKHFIEEKGLAGAKKSSIGFTFSFPVRQDSAASGVLMYWTKGFCAKGVVGKDVVGLLNRALAEKGLHNIKVAALANDTVGTLVARAYLEPACDVGVILGTGTNACYRERISRILKMKGQKVKNTYMLINTEWANFNKINTTVYDRILDQGSENPGEHILEKMISGMYLGEIARLVMLDLAKGGVLFNSSVPQALKVFRGFKTEYMSCVAGDQTAGLARTNSLLKKIGIRDSRRQDRQAMKTICNFISGRAACLSAAALAAVILKMDPGLSRRHTVAVDGTVYEKYPGFAEAIKAVLRRIFGHKSNKIKIILTKDGSGVGAAIIAAVSEES